MVSTMQWRQRIVLFPHPAGRWGLRAWVSAIEPVEKDPAIWGKHPGAVEKIDRSALLINRRPLIRSTSRPCDNRALPSRKPWGPSALPVLGL